MLQRVAVASDAHIIAVADTGSLSAVGLNQRETVTHGRTEVDAIAVPHHTACGARIEGTVVTRAGGYRAMPAAIGRMGWHCQPDHWQRWQRL